MKKEKNVKQKVEIEESGFESFASVAEKFFSGLIESEGYVESEIEEIFRKRDENRCDVDDEFSGDVDIIDIINNRNNEVKCDVTGLTFSDGNCLSF